MATLLSMWCTALHFACSVTPGSSGGGPPLLALVRPSAVVRQAASPPARWRLGLSVRVESESAVGASARMQLRRLAVVPQAHRAAQDHVGWGCDTVTADVHLGQDGAVLLFAGAGVSHVSFDSPTAAAWYRRSGAGPRRPESSLLGLVRGGGSLNALAIRAGIEVHF